MRVKTLKMRLITGKRTQRNSKWKKNMGAKVKKMSWLLYRQILQSLRQRRGLLSFLKLKICCSTISWSITISKDRSSSLFRVELSSSKFKDLSELVKVIHKELLSLPAKAVVHTITQRARTNLR